MEPVTLADVMAALTSRGFTEQFVPMAGRLRAVGSGKSFAADQVTIAEYHRLHIVGPPSKQYV